ncbi:GNAT family N-acetyltransferase [Candidatus Pantoea bituminis]|uniref:GNAT family N-acetyltransferase n=1 Tax=Candidatus Pantoea bituminis TaxID=2831036 RepID=UPI001C063466|nr:GNAT family N-acetyltransferase [Pantoea bituminis]
MANSLAIPVNETCDKLFLKKIENNEILMTLPLLLQLYPNLSIEMLTSRLEVIRELNWACVGVFQDRNLVGISGYWINTRFYCGSYLYIDHFIVDAAFRDAGVGTLMIQELKDIAVRNQCSHICLDTFTGNSQAQHFWARHKFDIVGFHYVLPNKH